MDLQQILGGAQDVLTARRIFGEPISVDGVTVIPAASLRGGGGGGVKNADEGGVGFGVKARPAGVYVVRDGDAVWRPAVDVNRIVLGGQMIAIAALLTFAPVLRRWATNGRQRA
jgi:uncharacterized spore protein YtfJ